MRRLLTMFGLLAAALPSVGQAIQKECPEFSSKDAHGNWQWMDRDCGIRTRSDLDKILANHKAWIKKYDRIAKLTHKGGVEGSDSDPLRANLSGAHLRDADLAGTELYLASLDGADLVNADLSGAHLSAAGLTGTHLGSADLAGAELDYADLTSAELYGADLSGTDFEGARLAGAQLNGADLTDADFSRANLSGSHLYDTDLSNADFSQAQFWNAEFQPKTIPPASGIARASGLWTLREVQYLGNKIPTLELRKALHDAGYIEAYGQVNLAYHRMEQEWWQVVLFDWTCEWGSNWRRPIGIVLWIGFGCSIVYWALVRFTRRNLLFVIGKKGKREQRLRVWNHTPGPRWFGEPGMRWLERVVGSPRKRARWEWKLYWTTLLFTVTNVLNLGVQGLDPGRWVRMMHPRSFDLEARGTIRTIAGVQSVLSFALLALAVLSYLGHPIE